MKLYTKPGTCSTGCHIALCWTGAKFDFEVVNERGMDTPEFFQLNPARQTPVLVDEDFVTSENVSVLHYISDSFPEARLLGDGSKRQRAEALKWLAFENSDMQPAFKLVLAAKKISSDPKVADALDIAGRKYLTEYYKIIDCQLEHQEWIAGFRSVADPLLFMTLNWARSIHLDLPQYPGIYQFFLRMQKDEGVVEAFRSEGLPHP